MPVQAVSPDQILLKYLYEKQEEEGREWIELGEIIRDMERLQNRREEQLFQFHASDEGRIGSDDIVESIRVWSHAGDMKTKVKDGKPFVRLTPVGRSSGSNFCLNPSLQQAINELSDG